MRNVYAFRRGSLTIVFISLNLLGQVTGLQIGRILSLLEPWFFRISNFSLFHFTTTGPRLTLRGYQLIVPRLSQRANLLPVQATAPRRNQVSGVDGMTMAMTTLSRSKLTLQLCSQRITPLKRVGVSLGLAIRRARKPLSKFGRTMDVTVVTFSHLKMT